MADDLNRRRAKPKCGHSNADGQVDRASWLLRWRREWTKCPQ